MSEAINWDRYWFRTSAVLPNEGELVLVREKFDADRLSRAPCLPSGFGLLIEGQWYGADFGHCSSWDALRWNDEDYPIPEGWRRLSGLPESLIKEQRQ